jgi:hypothetical protein
VRKREKDKVICNTTRNSFATANASQKQDRKRNKDRIVHRKKIEKRRKAGIQKKLKRRRKKRG